MDVRIALNEIENRILKIKDESHDERLLTYNIITGILNGLERYKKDIPSTLYNQYLNELVWSMESLCGLDDGNGKSDDQHVTWALGAINKLKSKFCFDI